MLQNLPELVLEIVCGHLSYEDLQALRCTCKDLKEFVDRKVFTNLNLFAPKFAFYHRLFYTDRSVGHPYSLHSDDLAILDSNRFRERFANLRKMTIFTFIWNYHSERTVQVLNLESLNCFVHLRQLEIKMPCVEGKLSLPELRVAAFNRCHMQFNKEFYLVYGSSFELDCPKLRALKLDWHTPFRISRTDQLDHLWYSNLKRVGYLLDIRQNIQNLSTIVFNKIKYVLQLFMYLKTDKLEVPSLSEIRLENCEYFYELDELARGLEDLKKRKKGRETSKVHVKFTLNGRLIDSPDKLREIASLLRAHDFSSDIWNDGSTRLDFDRIRVSTLLFLNENPTLNCLLAGVRYLELNEDIELNEQLIKNLKNIKDLDFWRCKPSESQVELISINCKSLCHLRLRHLNLTGRMLEMLSTHLINLERMDFVKCKFETFRPLAKFQNLEFVHFVNLDIDLQKDEIEFLYRNSQTLEKVSISGKNGIDLIRTTRKPKEFKILARKYFEYSNLDEMLDSYYANFPYEKESEQSDEED